MSSTSTPYNKQRGFMSIERILINVADVQRSVDFYGRYLSARPIGAVSDSSAVIDVLSATIEFARLDKSQPSTWKSDDLQKGFRHIGFKVANIDALAAELKADGVSFHLDPLDAQGGVRITFFYDPDGTLLEFVQGDLQYHVVSNEDGVAAERALGAPDRPRFDHIAITVDDLGATQEFYREFGFGHIGTINQPGDPRGFGINYLKAADTVLEVFTYEAEKESRAPQLDSAGFVAVKLASSTNPTLAGTLVGKAVNGTIVYSDIDGFLYSVPERADER
jgi:catechol 2,3-dioxygenase-like lactoylglutathione lyase family enzyme